MVDKYAFSTCSSLTIHVGIKYADALFTTLKFLNIITRAGVFYEVAV